MQHPGHASVVATVIAAFCALCALAALADARTTSRVRSNLDQKAKLPSRIPWNAYPSAPSSGIKEVDFLIDGTTRWIEQHPPYSYADGDGLVTTWLSPGVHRFEIRVIEKGGARSTDVVKARVPPAPAPPAALAGSWRRSVDTTSLKNPPGIYNPSGTYTLTFDERWIRALFPGRFVAGTGPSASAHNGHGWIIDAFGTYNASTISVAGAINYQLLTDSHQQGGFWCGPHQPAVYRWSVDADTLTLSAVKDNCAGRKLIWSGQWARTS